MKILIRLIAVAAAFGLSPAVAPAQDARPADVSAASQRDPAQPEEISPPALASGGEAPSDAAVAQTTVANRATPTPGIGQPDGAFGLQEQFTPIGEEAAWFHDVLLMPVITIITIFVLLLMVWVVIRYRRAANPEPSRTTHNTLIEVVWTLVPVIILVIIAVPSIRLLANQYSPPKADLTVKVIGNQWYWIYQYPDNGDFEIVSNGLSDKDAAARGEPRMLAVDERMVVPAGATVKVIVTSNDVIHAFGVPAFWVKMDAVPGRLNETWFKVDRPGLYYGQCYELCGARHAYMPIAVEVVAPAQFAAWVASKGGTMPVRSAAAAGVGGPVRSAAAGGVGGPVRSAAAGGVEGPGAAPPTSPDATLNSPISNPPAAGVAAAAPPASRAAESNPRVAE